MNFQAGAEKASSNGLEWHQSLTVALTVALTVFCAVAVCLIFLPDAGHAFLIVLLVAVAAAALAGCIAHGQMRAQRESGRQIRVREAQLRAAIEGGLDAVLIFEATAGQDAVECRVCFANRHAADLLGWSLPELYGKRLEEIAPFTAGSRLAQRMHDAMASEDAIREEIEFESGTASARWLHCQLLPFHEDVAGLVLIARDISKRKAEDVETRENRAFLQSLIEYLPVLIFAKSFRPDQYDKMIVWNQTAEHVMGYSAEQVIGKSNKEIFPDMVADTLNALDRQMLAAPKVVVIPEFPYRRPNGELCYLRSISVPLFSESGSVDYILGIVEDITARRSQEWALRTQRAELAAINDSLPVGLFRTDAEGKVVYVNPTFEKMVELEFAELARRGWHAALHPEDKERVLEEWAHAIHNDLPYQNTLRFQLRKGRVLWASLKAAQIRMDGKVRGYVASVDDITIRLQAEQDVLKGERWLRTIADNLPALIAYIDKDERYRFTNVNYEQLFHREGSTVLGSHVSEVFGGEYYAFSSSRLEAALRGERVSFEREGTDREGHKRSWRVEYIPDFQDGAVMGIYSMVLDISESKEVENRLRALARIDSLTGLANRSCFNERLEQAIASVDGKNLHVAVLFLDIDHFKTFNDNFGHYGGDQVLREFSRRLTACVRHTDTVARLAGDEFVILLLGHNMPLETEVVAKKIMAEMTREFMLPAGPCRVTTSIGITVRREGENDPDLILRRADDALYAAKAGGRNGFTAIL